MSSTAPIRRRRVWRMALALALLGATIWIAQSFDFAGWDSEAIGQRVRDTGPLAPALLIALLVVQSVVIPLPSQAIMMAAGFAYGPRVGLAISWFGVLVGACACFALARALGRPFVERFTRPERLDEVDTFVAERGVRATFFTVLSLRLFAHMAFDIVSYASGLVRFPFRWFVLATALGEIPKVFLFTSLGAGLGGSSNWLGIGIAAGTVATLALFGWLARRWRAVQDA